MDKTWNRIAVYLRISKRDKEEKESNSIQNQRSLLVQFIQNQSEFNGCDILEFSDDGYSGMDMNRPALIQLLEQVKEGIIFCIIVKDFSRFSRDYIELGTYLEQIFPFLGVRFISLNDQYDSAKETELRLESMFRNLLYDWYSKDLSIKVNSSLRAKKEKECFTCTRLPYGYKKDRKNPYGIEICKEEAEVVQMIFSLALQGKTLYETAKLLNQKGIVTQTATASSAVLWRASTIWQILKNPFYTGTMVYNKYERKKAGGKSIQKDQKEWKQVFYHHPAIIEKEQFEEVQNGYKKKREKTQTKPYPLKGKLLCGFCQKKLQRRNTKVPYFTCTTRYIAENKCCVKRLETDQMIQLIRKVFWQIILCYQMQESIKILRDYCQKKQSELLQKKLKQIEEKQLKWERKKIIKYKKYLSGSIKKEEYLGWNNLIQIQEKEQIRLQRKYHRIKIILKEEEQKKGEKEREEIQEAAEYFIKKILVFDGEKLVIYWNFQKPIKEEDF